MAANYKAQLAQMFTSAGGSHRDLAEKYKAVLDSILQLGEDELVDGLKAFIEAIVNENVSLVISRQLLSEVATEMAKVEDSISKAVSHYTLDIVQPRVISFEDQVGQIRQHLADIYEKEQNWKQAAQVCFRKSKNIISVSGIEKNFRQIDTKNRRIGCMVGAGVLFSISGIPF